MPNRVKYYRSQPAAYASMHAMRGMRGFASRLHQIQSNVRKYAGRVLYRGLTAAVRRRYR